MKLSKKTPKTTTTGNGPGEKKKIVAGCRTVACFHREDGQQD